MGWANKYIEQLLQGKRVQFRPHGYSMRGKVESGQLVTVEPIGQKDIQVGSIVLCEINGVQYLHLVKAISEDQVQIGNTRGKINGWTNRQNVFGVVTDIAD